MFQKKSEENSKTLSQGNILEYGSRESTCVAKKKAAEARAARQRNSKHVDHAVLTNVKNRQGPRFWRRRA